jgi:pimeloyl-ACP methyl ester carboxylesterase
LQRLAQIGISDVNHLFVTHLHSDHVVGIPDLYLTGWVVGRREVPFSVRGPEGTSAMMSHLREAFAVDIGFRISDDKRSPDGAKLDVKDITDKHTIAYSTSGSTSDSVLRALIAHYGIKAKPTGTGWDPDRIARAWAELMKRLGYTRYVAQGGDWGAPVSSAMARQAPAGLLGIHINLPATVPPEVAAALGGGPLPPGLSDKERAVFDALVASGHEIVPAAVIGEGDAVSPVPAATLVTLPVPLTVAGAHSAPSNWRSWPFVGTVALTETPCSEVASPPGGSCHSRTSGERDDIASTSPTLAPVVPGRP